MSCLKKTAFIGPLPPPIGGVAIINQSFQSINYDGFEVVAFDTSKKKQREDLYAKFKLKNVFRNIYLNKGLDEFIKNERPDVINIFITSGLAIFRDILFLKRISTFQVPIIIHFHSKTQGEFALTPTRLSWVGRYFNRYASRIVLLSDKHYNYFINYFEKEKCIVVENFVNYFDFNNAISNKIEEFLFVGRLSREKGFFDLLEAVKSIKEKNHIFRIQIIGLAPTDEEEREISQFIKEHNLGNYLVFNGAIYGEEKYKLFKKSSCLIFPSHFENSPVVIKEAIAAKMAILCSNIEANTNILQKRKNFCLFDKGNIEMLSNQLITLINNRNMVIEMCRESELIKEYDVSIAQVKMNSMFLELTRDEK